MTAKEREVMRTTDPVRLVRLESLAMCKEFQSRPHLKHDEAYKARLAEEIQRLESLLGVFELPVDLCEQSAIGSGMTHSAVLRAYNKISKQSSMLFLLTHEGELFSFECLRVIDGVAVNPILPKGFLSTPPNECPSSLLCWLGVCFVEIIGSAGSVDYAVCEPQVRRGCIELSRTVFKTLTSAVAYAAECNQMTK